MYLNTEISCLIGQYILTTSIFCLLIEWSLMNETLHDLTSNRMSLDASPKCFEHFSRRLLWLNLWWQPSTIAGGHDKPLQMYDKIVNS